MKKIYSILFFLLLIFSNRIFPQSAHLYVIDSYNCTVDKYIQDGTYVTTIPDIGSQLYYPYGIACDNVNNNLYVVESWEVAGIYKVPFSGGGYEIISNLADYFEVALDVSRNKVFATRSNAGENSNKGRIYVGDLSGSFNALAALDDYCDNPRGIATDQARQKLYIVNRSNILVANYNGSSPVTYNLGGLLDDPWGIALDLLNGKMYIVNRSSITWGPYEIIMANLDGTSPVNLGNPGNLLEVPFNIALDVNLGKMYISSSGYAPRAGMVVQADLDGTNASTIIPGISNYSPIGIAIDIDNPLPVELTSFTASMINNNVELKWETATEQNNYGFEVERASLGTTPGQGGNTPLNPLFPTSREDNAANPLSRGDERGVWETLGFVHGAGNSNSPKSYSYIDSTAYTQPGNVQYRLKQIDLDGNYKYYSQTAEVNFSMTDVKESRLAGPKEFGLSQNYPNPFNPTTTIQYSIPENPLLRGDERGVSVTLKIYDMLGKEVSTLVNETKSPGYYEVKFDASNLSAGVYLYRLTAGSFTSTKKLMLMK